MPPGTPVDLAIFTTKAHHLKDAMGRLRGSTPQAILGVQNGMAKDDLLWSVFGRNHVVGASTTTGADRQPDGTVLVTQRGNTYVGLLNRESPLAPQQERLLQELANSLTQQGYPTEVRTNIRAVEWSKVCNAGSTFGITVLTRVPVSDIWTRRPLVHAFLQLVREIATIAQETEGILVEDVPGLPILSYVSLSAEEVWERFGRKTPRPSHSPGHYPSMLQDLLAGRSLEVDEVFGDLVRRAAQRDIPVPHLDFVYHLITGLNA